METNQVNSSAVASMQYDEQTSLLTVTMNNGHAYTYSMVPSATHRAFLNSPSKGAYYNRYIKNKFHEQKVR